MHFSSVVIFLASCQLLGLASGVLWGAHAAPPPWRSRVPNVNSEQLLKLAWCNVSASSTVYLERVTIVSAVPLGGGETFLFEIVSNVSFWDRSSWLFRRTIKNPVHIFFLISLTPSGTDGINILRPYFLALTYTQRLWCSQWFATADFWCLRSEHAPVKSVFYYCRQYSVVRWASGLLYQNCGSDFTAHIQLPPFYISWGKAMRGRMWGSQLSHRWVPLQTEMLNAFSHPMCSSSWLVLIPQEFTKHKEDVFDIIYMSWKTRAMLHIIYGSLWK